MKKNYTPIQNESKNNRPLAQSIPLFILGFVIYILLYANVVASQKVPQLYYGFASESQDAVLQTLHKIRFLPEFPMVFEMQKNIYGQELGLQVNSEFQRRRDAISVLESLLQKNPNAKEVLYEVSLLYKENGENEKANEYLNRAKEIDPALK